MMEALIAFMAFAGGVTVGRIWQLIIGADRIAEAIEDLADKLPNFGRPPDDPRNKGFDYTKPRK